LSKKLDNFYIFSTLNLYRPIISVHAEVVFFLSILEKFSGHFGYRRITAMLTDDIFLGDRERK